MESNTPVPLPTLVVAGTSVAVQRRLLAALLAGRPPQERWAVLDNGFASAADVVDGAGGVDGPFVGADGSSVSRAGPAVARFPVPGGCACCIAGPAFRTALVRLLRAGPWEQVLVAVDPSGHAHAVVDQLRSPPFDRLLRVSRLLVAATAADCVAATPGVAVADATPPAPGRLAEQLAFASDLLVPDEPDLAEAAVRAIESAAPWPRLRRRADDDHRRSPADRRATVADDGLEHTAQVAAGHSASQRPGSAPGEGWHDLPPIPGWRHFRLQPSQTLEDERLLIRVWPGAAVAQRRALREALAALGASGDLTGFVALARTPRAWYRWAWGHAGRSAPLVVDDADLSESETTWRLDSRLAAWLAPGAGRDRVTARIEALSGLFEEP